MEAAAASCGMIEAAEAAEAVAEAAAEGDGAAAVVERGTLVCSGAALPQEPPSRAHASRLTPTFTSGAHPVSRAQMLPSSLSPTLTSGVV